MRRVRLAGVLACALIAAAARAAPPDRPYGARQDVHRFIQEMAAHEGFVTDELGYLFSRARRVPAILAAIVPRSDPRARSWQDYRARFVSERRIAEGVEFWQRNAAALERAAAEHGVPAEIVVAIVGIETFYGRQMGRYRVIDALTTLAFDYPPRAEFFRGELEQFLLFARETGLDVFSVYGSYAGAIGMPQFMPGSYRRYAIDYDKDGQVDLWRNPADVIGSVASYLKEFGWKDGEPVVAPARVEPAERQALLDLGLKPSLTLEQWRTRGADTSLALPDSLPACVFSVDLVSGPEFWFGFDNFYALLQYNRSRNYALAIVELAREIASERERLGTLPPAMPE